MKIKENIIYAVIFTFIFSFIFVFILSLTNQITKDRINKNFELFQRKAILNAMKIRYDGDNDAYNKFDKEITKSIVDNNTIFESSADSKKIYSVIITGNGLWGTITGVIALNSSITKIIGIDFISHSETPGLGGRIDEDWFKKQFDGEKINNSKITFDTSGEGKGEYSPNNGVVDSISGATRTSQFLEIIINKYIKIMSELKEDGKL